jgi:hypothetical protein
MPVRIISEKIIEIGTSFFLLMGSGHYDLPERDTSPVTTTTTQTQAETSTTTTTTITANAEKSASVSTPDSDYNFMASTVSVSCIRLTWNAKENADYTITLTQLVPDGYIDNVYFEFKSDCLCYVTGLRENTEYRFDLSDSADTILASVTCRTEAVEVIEEYEHEDGWTNCFTYESAAKLTLNPSWGAIQGCEVDKITDTGIMRDEYGDYCCAMGTFYGYVGDRLLVTLENGTQFTVKICDSKGDRRYHNFGNGGKSVIEFIYADGYLPDCTAFSGNYGLYNWSGLDLGANIESVKKINYGDTVVY